ncbi:MAG: DUF167 domain-containing protein [Candidatus Babeliaceae bacterium]|nr:DUF167 domain-containing protein [Candidatus Babeliaceae bacterium]
MTVILDIKVIPRSKKQFFKIDPVYALRCYVISPPEHNKANHEVVECLAKALKISKGSITILAGAAASIKRMSIEGFDSEDAIYAILNLEVQHALL